MSILDRLTGDDPDLCKHHEIAEWPDEDESIWYVVEKQEDDETYWSETDAAYIKLREVSRDFVCLGCGKEETIHTAEQVGGKDGIKLKSELSPEESKEFFETVHSGGFYNGWDFDGFEAEQ